MDKLKLILDTDVGADCDDMVAIAYLIYAKRQLGIELKAITHSNGAGEKAISSIRSMFDFLDEPCPIIGEEVGKFINKPDSYAYAVSEKFNSSSKHLPALDVLRKTLAENNKITICAIGPFTNIANLLKSSPDKYSNLNGIELVKQKCDKIIVMAGQFDNTRAEWNIRVDLQASKDMVELCPVPLVFLPFEIGENMITGGDIMKKYGETNPLALSFLAMPYGEVIENGGRHSWDPATTVFAVEGAREFFEESPKGTVTVSDDGVTIFSEDKNGKHSYLMLKGNKRDEQSLKNNIAKYIDKCLSELYD